jgi:cyclopropane-fatty-acyl-phospholipid synthase
MVANFLFVSRGGPWPLESIRADRPSSGNEAENKENIRYHYDVSNAFNALFLDPDMVYSCGYFTDWDNDIATAQRDKLEMICRKLRLKPEEKLLDVGCGWGGLICYAAQHYGVRAHGLTLSQQQYDYVRDKIVRLGLGDRVTIELKDYAGVQGQFDKIAQIEMIEHVGLANHETFFNAMNRVLKPSGLYLHQASMRPAKRIEKHFLRKAPEYAAITRYIFPGAEVDNIAMLIKNLQLHGFELHDVESWREHFARTCRHWHDRLLANREAAEREVGSDKTRLWLLYLFGCSLGFERGAIEIFQTLASKRVRGWSGMPPTRADLYH